MEISTKNKCSTREIRSLGLSNALKLSFKTKKHTRECIYNDLFKIFWCLKICGGGVKTLQTFPGATALIVDVANPNLTEIASHNIYIPK